MIERLTWCFHCLLTIVYHEKDGTTCEDFDNTFVDLLNTAIELLSPLTLFPSSSENITTLESGASAELSKTAEFVEKSQTIRLVIERLLRLALPFICIVPEDDKSSLMILCHKVMLSCIEFQEICCGAEHSPENDKRIKAENIKYALHNLDKLMNDSFLRLFLILCVELNQNPVARLRAMKESTVDQNTMDQQIDRFDDFMERLIQIGTFAMAHSLDKTCRCN